MADPTMPLATVDPGGLGNVLGNIPVLGGITDLPGAMTAWTASLTGMNQVDMIGLITIGLAVANIGVCVAAILEGMARDRSYSKSVRM